MSPSRSVGDAHGGDAGAEVADRHGGQAHVLPDQRDQLLVQLAAAVEAELRELQPFLEDLGRIGGEGAEDLAADLGPVRHRDAEGDHLPLGEDGHDQRDVGGVGAAAVGTVGHEDVAGAHRCQRVAGQDRLDLRPEGAGEEAEPVVLGDHLRLGVGDAAGEVEHLVDDRAHAGARQDDAHLAGDGEQLVADHLAGEGIRARPPSGAVRVHDGSLMRVADVRMQPGWAQGSNGRSGESKAHRMKQESGAPGTNGLPPECGAGPRRGA